MADELKMIKPEPTYLGDSVYAEWDGYYIRLYLDNGYFSHSDIYLEPMVLEALDRFRDALSKQST